MSSQAAAPDGDDDHEVERVPGAERTSAPPGRVIVRPNHALARGISFGTGFLGDGDGGKEVAAFDLLDGGDGDPADQAAPGER